MIVRPDFQKYFDECRVSGAIAIYNNGAKQWIVSDSAAVTHERLPASTFKIINLLIALETGVIADEKEVVKWPGSTDTVKYGYRPEIYHDMTVEEAFRVSAGWVFIELARRVGRDKYRSYLERSQYGNGDLSEKGDDFWNFGAFAISPMNQVAFVRSVYEGTAPFSKRNLEILKRVLRVEQQEQYTIYAKTGWTRYAGSTTGWWVGYLEKGDSVYFFATQLYHGKMQSEPNFGSCRKTITKAVFKELDMIE